MNSYICKRCGKEVVINRRIANNIKYCETCRREAHNIQTLNSYYLKIGRYDKLEEILPKKTRKWVWTGRWQKCPYKNCPFKSGNKPCRFYFEYADGTVTCPGIKYIRKVEQKNELAK